MISTSAINRFNVMHFTEFPPGDLEFHLRHSVHAPLLLFDLFLCYFGISKIYSMSFSVYLVPVHVLSGVIIISLSILLTTRNHHVLMVYTLQPVQNDLIDDCQVCFSSHIQLRFGSTDVLDEIGTEQCNGLARNRQQALTNEDTGH